MVERVDLAEDVTVYVGDCREALRAMPAGSVQCVVTSPPYWGLRDYGVPGQLGLEPTPEEYVANMVEVFREVWRVLRDDGTVWLNLGDSYAGSWGNYHPTGQGGQRAKQTERWKRGAYDDKADWRPPTSGKFEGLKPKDLVGVPWRIAFALQADGWYLRSDIIWSKPNPMPESVTDRPTRAHEYVFLLSKSGESQFWTHRDRPGTRARPSPDYRWIDRANDDTETDKEPLNWRTERLPDGAKRWARINLWQSHDYYYDADAIREPATGQNLHDLTGGKYGPPGQTTHTGTRPPASATFKREGSKRAQVIPGQSVGTHRPDREHTFGPTGHRNRRTVWTIATEPTPYAHFATFPQALVEPCILAGTSPQACPSCGAPWARVVGDPVPVEGRGSGNLERKVATQGQMSRTNTHLGYAFPWQPTSTPTTGWRPTCTCEDNDGSGQCVVLDPFGGSGTVGLVAARLGRRAVLCELSREYVEIMRKRLSGSKAQRQFGLGP